MIAPNDESYTARMTFVETYLSFFGIKRNHIKTKYSFTRTPLSPRHYGPVQIWDDSSASKKPSTTISPFTPTTLLGGLMSLSLNWSQAQKKILDDVHAILNIIQHKRLQVKEFLYERRTLKQGRHQRT